MGYRYTGIPVYRCTGASTAPTGKSQSKAGTRGRSADQKSPSPRSSKARQPFISDEIERQKCSTTFLNFKAVREKMSFALISPYVSVCLRLSKVRRWTFYNKGRSKRSKLPWRTTGTEHFMQLRCNVTDRSGIKRSSLAVILLQDFEEVIFIHLLARFP